MARVEIWNRARGVSLSLSRLSLAIPSEKAKWALPVRRGGAGQSSPGQTPGEPPRSRSASRRPPRAILEIYWNFIFMDAVCVYTYTATPRNQPASSSSRRFALGGAMTLRRGGPRARTAGVEERERDIFPRSLCVCIYTLWREKKDTQKEN